MFYAVSRAKGRRVVELGVVRKDAADTNKLFGRFIVLSGLLWTNRVGNMDPTRVGGY